MVVTLDHNGNAVCESCGKAFIDHPGIIGTCTEVQRLKQIIKDALAIYHTPQSSLRACIQMAEELNKANL